MLFESKKGHIEKTLNKFAKYKVNVLSWSSSFGEMRDKITFEAINLNAYDDIHTHEDIKPLNLTDKHIKAIKEYSRDDIDDKGASSNLNDYLRNRDGDRSRFMAHYDLNGAQKAVKTLSSAFTPENTNRKEITVYSGIPPRIGSKLIKSGSGSRHLFAGFTSTSTDQDVANRFARRYARHTDDHTNCHIIKAKLENGAGLSVAPLSAFGTENEILLHHGAHVTYHHTTTEQLPDGKTLHIHHVTIHASHKPLSEYGEYRT